MSRKPRQSGSPAIPGNGAGAGLLLAQRRGFLQSGTPAVRHPRVPGNKWLSCITLQSGNGVPPTGEGPEVPDFPVGDEGHDATALLSSPLVRLIRVRTGLRLGSGLDLLHGAARGRRCAGRTCPTVALSPFSVGPFGARRHHLAGRLVGASGGQGTHFAHSGHGSTCLGTASGVALLPGQHRAQGKGWR